MRTITLTDADASRAATALRARADEHAEAAAIFADATDPLAIHHAIERDALRRLAYDLTHSTTGALA